MSSESRVLVFFVDSDISDRRGYPHFRAFQKVQDKVGDLAKWHLYKGGIIDEYDLYLVMHSELMTKCLTDGSSVDVKFGQEQFQINGEEIQMHIEKNTTKVFVAELGTLPCLPDGHVLKDLPDIRKMKTANAKDEDYGEFIGKIEECLYG